MLDRPMKTPPSGIMGTACLGQGVQGKRVGLHAPPPMFQGHLQRGPQDANRRVADDDIDAVELLPELHKGFRQARRIADIRLNRHRAAAQIANGLAKILRFLVAVEVNNGHIATWPASLRAAARPIPRAPPVMKAVLPESVSLIA